VIGSSSFRPGALESGRSHAVEAFGIAIAKALLLVRPNVKQFGSTKSRKNARESDQKEGWAASNWARSGGQFTGFRGETGRDSGLVERGLSEAIRQMIDYSLKAWKRSERRKAPPQETAP